MAIDQRTDHGGDQRGNGENDVLLASCYQDTRELHVASESWSAPLISQFVLPGMNDAGTIRAIFALRRERRHTTHMYSQG
jgi:hypothetical protein